ncbi:MAG: type II secretion system F family protein [Gemmatimonadetes bacterium]|nr:type II secretion system F family protein [Gemmatimonadota bacterium]
MAPPAGGWTAWLGAGAAGAGSLAVLLGAYAWLDRRRLAEASGRRARLAAMAAGHDRVEAVLRADPGPGGAWWTPRALLAALTGQRRRRAAAIERQLPDAVDMLVNALRAGHALSAAVQFVGEQQPPPVGAAFARVAAEQQLGADPREALDGLQARLGTLDARLLVLAMQIQRETGGNLAEVLATIAQVVRERLEFRAQVEVLTAESRLSAAVLALLPPILFVGVRAMNPEYMAPLTATPAGRLLVGYGVVSLVAGTLLLRQMARVEV